MARILNYISEIVENLNKEVDYNTLLKNEDMYVIAKYISRNPRFLISSLTTSLSCSFVIFILLAFFLSICFFTTSDPPGQSSSSGHI